MARAKLRCLSFLIGSTTYSTSMCIHDFNFLTILIAQKLSFEKLCFIGEGGKRSYQKTWTCSSTLSLKCLPIISWDFQMEFKIVTVYSLPQTTMCISSNLAFSCPLIFSEVPWVLAMLCLRKGMISTLWSTSFPPALWEDFLGHAFQ